MAYSLKQLNDAIRSDPAAYAAECDAAFAKKVEAAARKIADHRGQSHIILLSRRPHPGTGREPLILSLRSVWTWIC